MNEMMTMRSVNRMLMLLLLILVWACNPKNDHKETQVELETEVKVDSLSNVKVLETLVKKDRLLGQINYKEDSSFIQLNNAHASKEIYLHRETYNAFTKMYEAAKKEGVKLTVISGTRNFYEQKAIWERKWKKYEALTPYLRAKKILEFSSMPGTSRHHWGTDIDINNLNDEYFLKGKGKLEYEWLVLHGHEFGFQQVYTSKTQGRTGYNEEKWHWSYMPLAKQYLSSYAQQIEYLDINGFAGSELADSCRMISDYVHGIGAAL